MIYNTFKCPTCGHTAQVSGETSLMAESNCFVQTRVCNHCHELYEEIIPLDNWAFEVLELTPTERLELAPLLEKHNTTYQQVHRGLILQNIQHKQAARQIVRLINEFGFEFDSDTPTTGCPSCGQQSSEVWRKEEAICPKCCNHMIRLTHTLT